MDEYLKQWDHNMELPDKDKKALLEQLEAKLQEWPDNVDVLCHLCRGCLIVADTYEKVGDRSNGKQYTERSLHYARRAVQNGPKVMEAHKWYCAAVGRWSYYCGTSDRIKCGYEFQEHRNIAVELNPNDHLMHHMYGRWCYEVASLTALERKLATTFFATPPSATYEQALESLMAADRLDHAWKTNQLCIAKCCLALKRTPEATKWIESAMALPVRTEEDAVSQMELESLHKKYHSKSSTKV